MSRKSPSMTEVFKISETNDNPGLVNKGQPVNANAIATGLNNAAKNIRQLGSGQTGGVGAAAGKKMNYKLIPGTNDANQRAAKIVGVDDKGNASELDVGTGQFVNNPEMSKSKTPSGMMK